MSETAEKRGRVPLKIFYFVDSLHLGGSENQLVQTALRLDRAKYQPTVGCLHRTGPLLEPLLHAGIDVLEFDPKGGLGSLASLRTVLRLALFLRRQRFDVIHTYDLYSNLLGIPAAWLSRVPLRISCRRDLGSWWWYTPRNRKILRKVLGLSHVIVVNSEAVRNFMIHDDGYAGRSIRVIRNGIALDEFVPVLANRRDLFAGVAPGDKLVTLVANLNVATKGHAELIEAAPTVIDRISQARFLLVGDGPERAGLEQRVQQMGLEDKVIFLGRRTDVPQVLKCSNLSVLPSYAEGLPNVVMESVAVGTPVVASRVGGIPELIEDGVSGLLVPPRDPEALAEAIIKMLAEPETAAGMAAVARDRLRQRFSFSEIIPQLEAIYAQAGINHHARGV